MGFIKYRWICQRMHGGPETLANVAAFCNACQRITKGMHWRNKGIMSKWAKHHRKTIHMLYALRRREQRMCIQHVLAALHGDE